MMVEERKRLITRRNIRTLRRWKKQWNEGGLEGLRYKQGKGGGRTPKLPDDIWEEIAKVAIAEAMDSKEVAVYIKDKYGVHYNHKPTWKKLRKDLISFGKPCLLDKTVEVNRSDVTGLTIHWGKFGRSAEGT